MKIADSITELIGNTPIIEQLAWSFDKESHEVERLPLPTVQLPSLLIATPAPARPVDCAEAVAADDQSPVINRAMANLVVQFVYELLTKKLRWMGAYIDLEAGTLYMVPAEPETVARMCGVKVDTLIKTECSTGYRYSLIRR